MLKRIKEKKIKNLYSWKKSEKATLGEANYIHIINKRFLSIIYKNLWISMITVKCGK